ncbi:MAG: PAS domain-containing protein [Kordiimonas sp.]
MTIWANPTHSIGAKFGDYSLLLGDDIVGRNKVTDYFYRFWCNLSRDGYKPTRADVRPASMKQYLDRLVLMDVQPIDQAFGLTVKLIGSHVAAFYGEIAGKDIREMDNEDAIKRIYNSSAKVIETGQPALSVTAGISKSKEHLEGFALYMPLFCEEGRVHKIMVSVDIKSLIK